MVYRNGASLTEVEKVFVSTDDAEIEEVAKIWCRGSQAFNLAQDESLVASMAASNSNCQDKYGIFDLFLSLPTTAPLRTQEDAEMLALLDENTDVVITLTPASQFLGSMVSTDDSGNLRLLVKNYNRRQDGPEAYDVTTLAYVLRPGSF